MIKVRRIQIGEADLLKQIRLTSLRDAPYAFGTTYDSALQRSEETWREKAQSTAQGADEATFIAFADDMPIGMAALFRVKGQADVGELVQVWVNPEYRGTNAGSDLMDGVFKWAGENNFRRIIAGVTKGNDRALKFYVKYGFVLMDDSAQSDANGVYLVKDIQ